MSSNNKANDAPTSATNIESLIGKYAETRCRIGHLSPNTQVIILGVIEEYKDPLLACELRGKRASFRLSDLNLLEVGMNVTCSG